MPSQTRTSASNHTGWGSGNGRVYNDNVCRNSSAAGWYYAYTYGFSTLGAGDTITGVRVRYHLGAVNWDFDKHNMQLCVGITLKGTAKTNSTMPECTGCSDAGQSTKGDSSDLWGMTAAAMKVVVNNGAFGVAFYNQNTDGNQVYVDGFEITVYYTSPTIVGVTRRSKVFSVKVGNVARRSRVDAVKEEDLTRRAEVIHAGVLEPYRRAEVEAVVIELGDLTRRSTLDAAKEEDLNRRVSVSSAVAIDVTRSSEVFAENQGYLRRGIVAPLFVEDHARRVTVSPLELGDLNRRAIIFAAVVEDLTRRATLNVARLKGEEEVIIKTVASSHGANGTGDGRIYGDGTCRTQPTGSVGLYYVYGFGFNLPDEANINGVKVEHHFAKSTANDPSWTNLLLGVSSSTATPYKTATATQGACGTGYESLGGSSDIWGATQDIINSTVRHPNFSVHLDFDMIGISVALYTDGYRVSVYYEDFNNKRRGIVAVATGEDLNRESRVTVATGKDSSRESRIDIESQGWVRRAVVSPIELEDPARESSVSIENQGWMRRAEIFAENQGYVRRAEAFAENQGYMRRSEVFILSAGWVRGAEVSPAVGKDVNRESRVSAAREEEYARRATIAAAVEEDYKRESRLNAAVEEDVERRSELEIINHGYTRRAHVHIEEEHVRYARVTATTGGDVNRGAYLFVKVWWIYEDLTRRSEVFTYPYVPEATRRAIIDIDGAIHTRRAKVVATDGLLAKGEKRRATLAIAGGLYTRRSEITVGVGWTEESSIRRGKIFATRGWYTRRAIVTVDRHGADYNRRVVVSVTGTSEFVRRGVVESKWYYIINDDERRAIVHAWTPDHRRSEVTVGNYGYTRRVLVYARVYVILVHETRRSIVDVYRPDDARRSIVTIIRDVIIGDEERRSIITIEGDIYTRRAIITVTAAEVIGDDERRAIIIIEGGVYTRRATITVTAVQLITDDERRAIITVEPDHVRRAVIYVIVSEGYTRRAIVHVLGTDRTRRSKVEIYVQAYLFAESIRRAVLYAEPDHMRRAIIIVDSGGDVRSGRVKVFTRWFYGGTNRRAHVYPVKLEEYIRRSEVFAVFVGEEVRRSIVYGLEAEDYNRRSSIYVMVAGNVTRRAVVLAAQKEKVRLTIILRER